MGWGMSVKYLKKLTNKDFEVIAEILKFVPNYLEQPYVKNQTKSIVFQDDKVKFTYLVESSKAGSMFQKRVAYLNDFQIFDLYLASDHEKKMYYDFQNFMLSKFRGTEYENDRQEYFFGKKNTHQKHDNSQSF